MVTFSAWAAVKVPFFTLFQAPSTSTTTLNGPSMICTRPPKARMGAGGANNVSVIASATGGGAPGGGSGNGTVDMPGRTHCVALPRRPRPIV
jgi:hypothetical protein